MRGHTSTSVLYTRHILIRLGVIRVTQVGGSRVDHKHCVEWLAMSLTSCLHGDQVRVAGLDGSAWQRGRHSPCSAAASAAATIVNAGGRGDGAGQRGVLARDAVVDALLQRDVRLARVAHSEIWLISLQNCSA